MTEELTKIQARQGDRRRMNFVVLYCGIVFVFVVVFAAIFIAMFATGR